MNKYLLMLGLVVFISVSFAERVLKVGIDGTYPPFNQIDKSGEIVGFDVDITHALCVQMQRDCKIVKIDWDGLIPALKARKIDAIIASMNATAKRKKVIDFTDFYYKIPIRSIRKKGTDTAYSKADLKGKVIGVQTSTTQADYMHDHFAQVAEIKTYNSNNEAILDLQT